MNRSWYSSLPEFMNSIWSKKGHPLSFQFLYDHRAPGLAPMEGVGDFPLRLWIWLCSAPSSMGTPFLRATQTWPNSVPEGWAPELLVPGVGDGLPYALVPQIMSPHPEQFLRVAHQLLPQSGVVEVNCGCPAPTDIPQCA